ncbi:MAG TPA: TIGR03435 family protein [Vicinamibacterales bacterium]|nr:TIGR03435 family protein [Vicinamibacterales bacterium]
MKTAARAWAFAAGGFAIFTIATHAQAPASLTFDVASIKTSGAADAGLNVFPGVFPSPDGSVRATNATLRVLIGFAYNVEDDQILGGPPWQLTSRFDINARPDATGPRTTDAARQRLKALLADRFHLQAHDETREMTVSALVRPDRDAALGPNLKPTTTDCTAAGAECRTFVAPTAGRGGPLQMSIRGVGMPLSALCKTIGQAIGRRVIDGTGLTGLYDFEMELPIDPEVMVRALRQSGVSLPPGAAPRAADPSDTPAMTTIVQQRLGLRLETQKAQVPVLVIDGAEMPTPD